MIRRRKRTAACGPRPSDSGIDAASGSRPTQRMLSCVRCAALSFARKDNSAEYDRDASANEEGPMRLTLRGPLGWALAAGLVLATACNSVSSPGATSSPAKTARIGGLDRPIQLAFTPSTQAATISTNGAAI